jgi:hypothetical protein
MVVGRDIDSEDGIHSYMVQVRGLIFSEQSIVYILSRLAYQAPTTSGAHIM